MGAQPDPGFELQWNFEAIGMKEAWEHSKGGGAVVAVLDSGVMIQDGPRSVIISDLSRTATTNGYDFAYDDAEPEDFAGHGTHVTGTIAQSTDNGTGVAGIAPAATILPVKVLGNNGSGENSAIAAGIRYATDKGAHIINMSLGGPLYSGILKQAIEYAVNRGVTVICAAGNSGDGEVQYPAGYDGVVAVSATDRNGNIAPYSSYGLHVTLAAPGR